MLNSHEFFSPHVQRTRAWNLSFKIQSCEAFFLHRTMAFALLINFKMPTIIVGILKFMTRANDIVLCKKNANNKCWHLKFMTRANAIVPCKKNANNNCWHFKIHDQNKLHASVLSMVNSFKTSGPANIPNKIGVSIRRSRKS